MRSGFISLVVMALPVSAIAAQCPIEVPARQVRDFEVQFYGAQARDKLPVLHEIETLSRKAKNPARPLGDQLSSSDRARFQSLREKLMKANGRQLALSNYARDVQAILQMLAVSEALLVGAKIEENDPRFIWSAMLTLMQVMDPIPDLLTNAPKDDICNLDAGLYTSESLAADSLMPNAAQQLQSAMSTSTTIAKKYRLNTQDDAWHASIPDSSDRSVVIQALAVIADAQRAFEYMYSVERLRKLNSLSLKIYRSKEQAFVNMRSESELAAVFALEENTKATLPENDQVYGLVLSKIQERLPSAKSQELAGTARRLDQGGVK